MKFVKDKLELNSVPTISVQNGRKDLKTTANYDYTKENKIIKVAPIVAGKIARNGRHKLWLQRQIASTETQSQKTTLNAQQTINDKKITKEEDTEDDMDLESIIRELESQLEAQALKSNLASTIQKMDAILKTRTQLTFNSASLPSCEALMCSLAKP